MKKKYNLSLILLLAFLPFFRAQELEQGKRFFYYERYKSAGENFQKALERQPTDEKAIYWLGQTYLETKDIAGAKALYQKYLTDNPKLDLVSVGKGHLDLLENKTDEAQRAFQEAAQHSGGKDVEILNAIARAQIKANKGDARYALQKLEQAVQVRKFKNPETYILMGDAYKKGDHCVKVDYVYSAT